MNTDNSEPTNPQTPLAINSAGDGNKPPDGRSVVATAPSNAPYPHDVPQSVSNPQIVIRLSCGYTLVVLSIIGVLFLLLSSLRSVDLIQFTSPSPFTYDYVRLSVRGLITLAGVFFCHRLIQVGERMVIPVTLLRNSEDLKLLLGGNKIAPLPLEYINGFIKIIKSVKE